MEDQHVPDESAGPSHHPSSQRSNTYQPEMTDTPMTEQQDQDRDAPGPSRPRRPLSDVTTSESPRPRPATPESTLSRQNTPPTSPAPHLDLVSYPTATLLRLLAHLLQQIALANDQLRPEVEDLIIDTEEDTPSRRGSTHEAMEEASSTSSGQRPSPTTALFTDPIPPVPNHDTTLFTASKMSLSHPSSLLSFHARHIPSITIEAYLLRILKYCPTTNEVFLGLLVYFDRMSRLGTPLGVGGEAAGAKRGFGKGFAIDSYNVHRLVIAGVTVASKFFSDVFYTNSRYAKVGGLPPHELNQLELQFLLLNDFRLTIPTEEMQRYGDRLLGYWEGREAEIGVDFIVPPTDESRSARLHMDGSTSRADDSAQRSEVRPSESNQGPADQSSDLSGLGFKTHQQPMSDDQKRDSHEGMDVDPPTAGGPPTSSAPSDTHSVTRLPPTPPPSGGRPSTSSPDTRPSTNSAPPRGRTNRAVQFAETPRRGVGFADSSRTKDKGGVASAEPTRSRDKTPAVPAESAGVPESTHTGRSSGLRDWVRSDEVIGGVIGGRMTSPMRD